MYHSGGTMGSHKHGVSGHCPNSFHFTGKRKSKSKRKNKTTIKQRRAKMNTHKNKYLTGRFK